jgi:hypothetical protein
MHKWSDITDWGPKRPHGNDTPRFCKPRLSKLLGKGAFKTVYRCYDCIKGAEVAWSEVGIGHLSVSERAKILQEVRMMKKLKHENLIDLVDHWFDSEKNKVGRCVATAAATAGTAAADAVTAAKQQH